MRLLNTTDWLLSPAAMILMSCTCTPPSSVVLWLTVTIRIVLGEFYESGAHSTPVVHNYTEAYKCYRAFQLLLSALMYKKITQDQVLPQTLDVQVDTTNWVNHNLFVVVLLCNNATGL